MRIPVSQFHLYFYAILAEFLKTWEVISTITSTFIGIIVSCIEYKIEITTNAILATKWSWSTFAAWISLTYFTCLRNCSNRRNSWNKITFKVSQAIHTSTCETIRTWIWFTGICRKIHYQNNKESSNENSPPDFKKSLILKCWSLSFWSRSAESICLKSMPGSKTIKTKIWIEKYKQFFMTFFNKNSKDFSPDKR